MKTEMEEGRVGNAGQNWKKGKPEGTKLGEALMGGEYITYYRCQNCGLILQYTK